MKKITVTKDMALTQLRNMLDLVFKSIEQTSTDRPLFQTSVSLTIKQLQEMDKEGRRAFHDKQMEALIDAVRYLTADAVLNEKLKK